MPSSPDPLPIDDLHAAGQGILGISSAVALAPEGPGVYRFFSQDGRLLYVGKAKVLKRRLRAYLAHAMHRLPRRMQRCVQETSRVELFATQTEQEALLLEASLVRAGKPRDNVLLQDGGHHARLVLDPAPYPRLRVHRGTVPSGTRVLATFGDGGSARRVEEEVQRLFGLRVCDDNTFSRRSRPCLLYQIHRCSGPCVGLIDQAAYARSIDETQAFLKQDPEDLRAQTLGRMQQAAEQLEFERAARLRDRLRALDRATEGTGMGAGLPGDLDVLVLARAASVACLQDFLIRGGRPHGGGARFPRVPLDIPDPIAMEGLILQVYAHDPAPPRILVSPQPRNVGPIQRALSARAGHPVRLISAPTGPEGRVFTQVQTNATQALQRRLADVASHQEQLVAVGQLFGLDHPPRRIELYDNSHLSGTGMVGAMVVVGPEGVDRAGARVFRNVGPVTPGDDLAMMQAVLRKRLNTDLPLPDLFLIDGGQTQRAVAAGVVAEFGLTTPVVGIAKGPDRHAGREHFFLSDRVFDLPKNDPRLFALQRWRDAVHDKAVRAQRKVRREGLRTRLDDIPGVGPAKRRALIQRFGSSAGVGAASIQDLMGVKGIREDLARRILSALNPS